ncbi:MAG: M1 family peptidase [Porphyromonadaceae bacterium]|nr:MAG: M1 family peptidase [Porphyromonadaceae bacterium]
MIKKILPFAYIILWFIVPGISLAKDGYHRNPDVDIIHYCFRIYLNDSTDRIEGSAGITFNLAKKTRILELDLVGKNSKGSGMVIDRIESGTHLLTYQHENNRIEIEIPDTLKTPGTFTLSVNYSGIPADGLIISKNKFGERTFFGDNWPDRARNWLPCVDHPSDKATVEFIVSAPEKYKVVSNGLLIAGFPVIPANSTRNWVTHWKEDVPVPTKVMVIGAADFAWETVGLSKGIPIQSWVYAQDREPGFIDYKPALDIVNYYQDLIGPYSYEKLANVQSRTIFGGMENSGCIFYYEGSITGKNQLHSLLAHEIAHQWFGDAVTENDWHHIWISEGFATYLEACYADSLIPDRKLDASMADMRKSVIEYYEKTHKPVIDTTIRNYMDLLNTNSYQKGAWVLHMLRQELGDKVFWTGIRNFYAAYRDKNAMTSDLQSVMEEASGRSLRDFFFQWLDIPGQPVIQWSWTYNKKKSRVEIDVEQTQSQHNFVFKLPLELCGAPSVADPAKPGKSAYYQVPITEKKVHVTLPVYFPIREIRLDPKIQLLFQGKMVTR